MKKIFILLFALVLFCSFLTSCNAIFGNSGNDGTDDTTDDNNQSSGDNNNGGVDDKEIGAEALADVVFADKKVTYDGSEKNIIATNLPTGVSVKYTGNGKINAGEYTVTAKFFYLDEYIDGADRSATLTIGKAKYDMSGISFSDKELTYDGNEHSIELLGDLPRGVSVTYDGNGKINAGTYTVTAVFESNTENYEPIANMSATLSIKKARYDMSGVSFDDKTVTYSREEYSLSVLGTLPEGVSVSYDGNGKIDVGAYTVVAMFVGDNVNYEPIPTMSATLTIEPFYVSGIVFADEETEYDGTPKSIFVSSTIPSDVEVIYEGNGKTDVGSYVVTVSFVTDNTNYGEFPVLTATLTIVKGNYSPSFTDKQLSFDGKYHSVSLDEELPAGISVSFLNNELVAIGKHTVTAVFEVDGTRYNPIEDMSITVEIVLGDYETPASDFEYSSRSDGTMQIDGYIGTDPGVVIPEAIDGKAVTSIATESFKSNKTITFVYINDAITNIGNNAFAYSSLKNIRLGNSIEVIGASAFKGTLIEAAALPSSLISIGSGAFEATALKEITLPFIGGSHTSSNSFLGYIFGSKNYSANSSNVPDSLRKVILSDACTRIPAYAFWGCSGITDVVIGNSVQSIGNSAFSGCTGINSIYVPKSVQSIPANTYPYNSPFYNASSNILVVFEDVAVTNMGEYALYTSETNKAISLYGKTYDDYILNKDGSYRDFDPTDSKLISVMINGSKLSGFTSSQKEYTVTSDVTSGIKINYTVSSFAATVSYTPPTVSSGNAALIKVVSADGSSVSEYRINFNFTSGTTAEIVNKNGADATVTFVIDDGHQGTATFAKSMILKYSNLGVSYAVKTKDLATLKTEDTDGDGIAEYVMVDGKYTYEINQTNYAFWQDILSAGRSEIVSHTHTHTFWGTNDDGGVFEYVKNATPDVISTSKSMPKGSSTKEMYAPLQILEELFGEYISKNGTAISLIDAGISVKTSDMTINGVTVTTYKKFFKELWKKAYNEGKLISVRATFGQNTTAPTLSYLSSKVVIPSRFDSYDERIVAPGYMVEHYNANSDGLVNDDISNWTNYIDEALKLNGWAGFCIHNIYEKESSSGHNITYAQAEKLFAYAAEKNIWVATYTAAALYYSEWSTAKVTSSYANGKVDVTLTDNERDDVYNEELTVKVSVPATWESAEANGKSLEVQRNSDGSAYVYVNIIPDSGTVSICGK